MQSSEVLARLSVNYHRENGEPAEWIIEVPRDPGFNHVTDPDGILGADVETFTGGHLRGRGMFQVHVGRLMKDKEEAA